MKYPFPIFLLILGLSSCTVEPQPLQYGKDACQHCRMVLMDSKFGAELVTVKGKVYKFDDVNCMLNYLNAAIDDERQIQYRLVVDYLHPGKLIDAGNAFYIKSPEIKSPMASQVAAFEHYQEMESYKKQVQGIYLTWGELVTQFK